MVRRQFVQVNAAKLNVLHACYESVAAVQLVIVVLNMNVAVTRLETESVREKKSLIRRSTFFGKVNFAPFLI